MPPPTLGSEGDDGGDDFPLLRSSGAAASDPSGRVSAVSPPWRLRFAGIKLGPPVFGDEEDPP